MAFVPAKIRLIVARRIAEARDATGLAVVRLPIIAPGAADHRVQRMTRSALLVEEIGAGWFDGRRKRHLRATDPNACGGEGGNRRKPRARKIFPNQACPPTPTFFCLRPIIDPCLTL